MIEFNNLTGQYKIQFAKGNVSKWYDLDKVLRARVCVCVYVCVCVCVAEWLSERVSGCVKVI